MDPKPKEITFDGEKDGRYGREMLEILNRDTSDVITRNNECLPPIVGQYKDQNYLSREPKDSDFHKRRFKALTKTTALH